MADFMIKVEGTIKETIQGEFQKIKSEIFEIRKEADTLKREVHDLNKEVQSLKEENNTLAAKTADAFNMSVLNEQYSRKTNLKIYGATEERDENCEEVVLTIIREHLGITLTKRIYSHCS